MEAAQDYAIIILAAGNSSRLGEPKQLLAYQKKTLIEHVTEAALGAKPAAVIVVTGSNASLIEQMLHPFSYHSVHNPAWESGMGSSIAAGVEALLQMHPHITGALFAVSDQPFVTSELFTLLIDEAIKADFGIIASSYGDTLGTPVLFTKQYFPELLKLNGVEGAKKLVKRFTHDVTSISFPLGNVDIDTQEDYQKLLRKS